MSDDLTCPIETIDPARMDRFATGAVHDVMTRLRHEAPVHHTADSVFGPYWSITHYKDIVEVEALPLLYSSEMSRGGVSLVDADFAAQGQTQESPMEMFIAMDPPRHTEKRRVVAPAFTPSEITRLADNIRERTANRLDSLPRGEVFNWTKEVSISLTTDMLAILFDFPWEERHKLTEWSDGITNLELIRDKPQERQMMMFEMAMKFFQLWQERLEAAPAPDLLSRMIHSNALGKMEQTEFIGNMALLIVGGNDTTRNSMSGLIDALNRWPEEWEKIKANPAIIPNAAQEIIRWQSPVNHMRRTVTKDHEFRGHQFREGDKVVIWYMSGNRDEDHFEDGARFIADRENARRHLSFGYGVHRCVGARLAELQITTLLEEMVKRDMRPELAGEIDREAHPFVSIIKSVPVRIAA
ncbi:MAG: cytochrome P450 [Sphingomonadales bacterium]|nr:cytochrome P450 [Sphingomonadales bacterium]